MKKLKGRQEEYKKRKKMLLHVCCANCAMYPVDILKKEFHITLFFYNPNIHPEDEYEKRFYYFKKVSDIYKLPSITGKYDIEYWFDITKLHKNEPEGGRRCEICFRMRLEKAAETAMKNNLDIIATTLSVSPHKNAKTINKIGVEISEKHNIQFYPADFKKNDGFKKTTEMSKKYNFYRQDYCGCIYSMRK
jgi:predicted adenine nucleotide alpha hydrolase (AANH) superfamily ATPase